MVCKAKAALNEVGCPSSSPQSWSFSPQWRRGNQRPRSGGRTLWNPLKSHLRPWRLAAASAFRFFTNGWSSGNTCFFLLRFSPCLFSSVLRDPAVKYWGGGGGRGTSTRTVKVASTGPAAGTCHPVFGGRRGTWQGQNAHTCAWSTFGPNHHPWNHTPSRASQK